MTKLTTRAQINNFTLNLNGISTPSCFRRKEHEATKCRHQIATPASVAETKAISTSEPFCLSCTVDSRYCSINDTAEKHPKNAIPADKATTSPSYSTLRATIFLQQADLRWHEVCSSLIQRSRRSSDFLIATLKRKLINSALQIVPHFFVCF